MILSTTPAEILIITMKGKLEQVCSRGTYEVIMLYDGDTDYNRMIAYALLGEDKICIGEITFECDTQHLDWCGIAELAHVDDRMKATLMLLYGELT